MAQIFEPSKPIKREKIIGEGARNAGKGKRESASISRSTPKAPIKSKNVLKRGEYNG